jgi:C4-type Zn-finger protein
MTKNGEKLNSIEGTLGRIEERVENLIDSNEKEHREIIGNQKELTEHVNHEISEIRKQIKILMDKDIYKAGEKKGEKKIWKKIAAILGALSLILGILAGLGII